MASQRRPQQRQALISWFLVEAVLAQGAASGCGGDGNQSCLAEDPAEDSIGLLQHRARSSHAASAALQPARGGRAAAAGGAEVGLDMLVMADIGHAREYAKLLTYPPIPMGYGAVEGSFSLYDGIANYITQQGARPKAALIAGDVGYGGGTKKALQSMKDSFQKYTHGSLPENMVFPGIGNHDVNYLGCTSTPQLGNLAHPKTCFYGSELNLGNKGPATVHSMSYSDWMSNWAEAFPGLSGGTVILPNRTTPGTCKTTGGTAKGAPCKFPFKYPVLLGQSYNGCIKNDHDRPWCYTEGGGWGDCSLTCTPDIASWAAPTRYNLDLDPGSSVYIIVGLIAGTELNYWNGDTPPGSVPVGGASGAQAECLFLSDSLAHGRKLGKSVFIYATHWFQEGCDDWSLIQQIDIWIYGHDHNIWQNAPSKGTVMQEQRYFPATMLIGNGGYGDGQSKVVSFVHLTEEIADGRTRLNFKVLDTCISAQEHCPEPDSPPLDSSFIWTAIAQCWHQCRDFSDGYNKRKAVDSTLGFGFTYDAPRSAQGAPKHSLDFPVKLQVDSKWIALGDCGSSAVPSLSNVYRSKGDAHLVDPHAANLQNASGSGGSNGSGGSSNSSSSTDLSMPQTSVKTQCMVAVDDESEADVVRFYDVGDASARLAVESDSRAPVVQSGGVLLQQYGFYDLYSKQPTAPYTSPTGIGRMQPHKGYLFKFSSDAGEGANMALSVGWKDGVLHDLEDHNVKVVMTIVRA